MLPSNPSTLNEAAIMLRKIYGSRLAKIILFGSYARGEQTPESDIDLLVVLKDPGIAVGKEIRFMSDSLFDIGYRHNISISAHPVSEIKYETKRSFFLNRVRKEGKELILKTQPNELNSED